MAEDLPLVRKAGGEVAEVLGWEQHQKLTNVVRNSIARFAMAHPDRVNEKNIDIMADMSGWLNLHGADMLRLCSEFDPELVGHAAYYLYAIGNLSSSEHDIEDVETAVHAFSNLEDAGVDITNDELVEIVFQKLDGFGRVVNMSPQQILHDFYSEDPIHRRGEAQDDFHDFGY